MQIKHLTEDQHEEWNAFAAQEPHFAILQSWEWGGFKEKLGWKAFRVAVVEGNHIVAGAQMLVKSLPGNIASVAYIPRGPIGNWLAPQIISKLFAEFHAIASQCKAIFLKIEPAVFLSPSVDQALQEIHFCRSPNTNQPQATIVLDISADLETLLMQMRKKTRQYIRSALREDIEIRVGNIEDIPAFVRMMQDTARREAFAGRSRRFYEEEWKILSAKGLGVLFLAYRQKQLIAVRTAYCFGSQAAELHAGSSPNHSDLHPNYLLVWEAIKWAKERGCVAYDMWGIPDEIGQTVYEGNPLPVSDRTDGLWGVYRFKTGFGKKVEYYAGAYDYIYKPWVYHLIHRVVNKNNIEQIASRLDPRTLVKK